MTNVIDSLSTSMRILKENTEILMLLIGLVVFDVIISLVPLGIVGSIVSFIVIYIVLILVVQMTITVLRGEKPDLKKEWEKISPRFSSLLLIAIVAGLISITVILIPIALFMIVIAVLEKPDLGEVFSKSLDFVIKNLSDVLVLLVIALIASIIGVAATYLLRQTGYIAVAISSLINTLITFVVVMAASIYYYNKTKTTTTPPPPPIAPPPPPLTSNA